VALAVGGAHVDELLERFARAAPSVEGRRRTSCSAMFRSIHHPGPFGRRWSPARSGSSPGSTLESPTDASLSHLGTWPGAPGISPAGRPAGAVREASGGTIHLLYAHSHDVDQVRIVNNIDAQRRTDHTIEAARDNARRSRGGNSLTAPGSMPPISGHGPSGVVNIKFSDGKLETQKAWSWRSRPSLFSAVAPSTSARPAWPSFRRSSVNGDYRPRHSSPSGRGIRCPPTGAPINRVPATTSGLLNGHNMSARLNGGRVGVRPRIP
jgi:hypothetical protein